MSTLTYTNIPHVNGDVVTADVGPPPTGTLNTPWEDIKGFINIADGGGLDADNFRAKSIGLLPLEAPMAVTPMRVWIGRIESAATIPRHVIRIPSGLFLHSAVLGAQIMGADQEITARVLEGDEDFPNENNNWTLRGTMAINPTTNPDQTGFSDYFFTANKAIGIDAYSSGAVSSVTIDSAVVTLFFRSYHVPDRLTPARQ